MRRRGPGRRGASLVPSDVLMLLTARTGIKLNAVGGGGDVVRDGEDRPGARGPAVTDGLMHGSLTHAWHGARRLQKWRGCFWSVGRGFAGMFSRFACCLGVGPAGSVDLQVRALIGSHSMFPLLSVFDGFHLKSRAAGALCVPCEWVRGAAGVGLEERGGETCCARCAV